MEYRASFFDIFFGTVVMFTFTILTIQAQAEQSGTTAGQLWAFLGQELLLAFLKVI